MPLAKNEPLEAHREQVNRRQTVLQDLLESEFKVRLGHDATEVSR